MGSDISKLQNVCFQDQNGYLTTLSSSSSLAFGFVNGPVLSGNFASREESLKSVIGNLGCSPFGGNVMLSGKLRISFTRALFSYWAKPTKFERLPGRLEGVLVATL